MSGLFKDENSIFLVVNDVNSSLAYLCDVDPDGLVHLVLIIHACLTLILLN